MRYVKSQKNAFENIGVEYYSLPRSYYAHFSRQRSCGANLCITGRSDLTRGASDSSSEFSVDEKCSHCKIRLSHGPMITCLVFVLFVYIHTYNAQVRFHLSPIAASSRERQKRRHLTAVFRELLRGDARETNDYREHVRVKNLAVAFDEWAWKWSSGTCNGMHCLRIRGQVRHFVSPLNPNTENKPGCGQAYILSSA
jgi:hypothetical protein